MTVSTLPLPGVGGGGMYSIQAEISSCDSTVLVGVCRI
jgi:hypothetical protein